VVTALAQLVVDEHRPLRRASERFQGSPATAKKWADRYRDARATPRTEAVGTVHVQIGSLTYQSLSANYGRYYISPLNGLESCTGRAPQLDRALVSHAWTGNTPRLSVSVAESLLDVRGCADRDLAVLPARAARPLHSRRVWPLSSFCSPPSSSGSYASSHSCSPSAGSSPSRGASSPTPPPGPRRSTGAGEDRVHRPDLRELDRQLPPGDTTAHEVQKTSCRCNPRRAVPNRRNGETRAPSSRSAVPSS
jgi:hypothetical protein